MENISNANNIGQEETKIEPLKDLIINNVNSPSHYSWIKELGIKELTEVNDITRHLNFNLGNAIKYILRSGKKPMVDNDLSDNFKLAAIQDLSKAIWYLNDEIKRIEKWGL